MATELDPREKVMAQTVALAMRVRGITDAKMAELTGLTRQVVQQRRTGVSRIRPYDLERFATALGVPEDVLRRNPPDLLHWFAEHDDMLHINAGFASAA